MRRTTLILAALLAAGALGWTLGEHNATPEPAPAVHCPTEDSCEIDYRDGQWHITPVTP